MKRSLHRIFALAVILSMVFAFASCGNTPSGGGASDPGNNTATSTPPANGDETPVVTEVKVGYTSLQSGALAAIGPLIDTCVNIALEDFQARSNVKINLVIEDAGSTVESAIDATVRLIDDDVSCIIGIVGSNQYAGMLQELEGANIPLMTTVAPDEIFTRGYDWLFSSYVTRLQENSPMIPWAQSIGAESVACLLGTDDDSRALMEYFQAKGEEVGITIYPEWINPQDNDFTANITSARKNNPDAYFCLAADVTMSKILRQMKQMGIQEPFNTGGAMGVQSFIDLMEASELEGMYGQASILPPYIIDDQRVADYIAKYTEATGYPADITTLVYYDCAMLLFEAAAATGGDSEAIKNYLRNDMQGYEGLTGVFNYDERGLGRWEAYLIKAGPDKEIIHYDTVTIS